MPSLKFRRGCCQCENKKFHKKFSPYGRSQFANSQFGRIAVYFTTVARARGIHRNLEINNVNRNLGVETEFS